MTQTGTQTQNDISQNTQTDRRTRQTQTQAGRQAGWQAGRQAGQAGRQTGRQTGTAQPAKMLNVFLIVKSDPSCCCPDLLATGTTLASRHTAPATTGDATLVPDRLLQPPWILLPNTSLPYATTSGCMNPIVST